MILEFNANTVAPSMPLEAVPEGWYPVLLIEEEQLAVTGKPQSWRLALKLQIIDGAFKGRTLLHNLNLGNDNPKAVEIAQKELSAICHCTGVFVLSAATGGTAALKGKPFQVRAVVSGAYNEIKGFKDAQGNDPGKSGAGQAAHAPAPAAGWPAAAAPGGWPAGTPDAAAAAPSIPTPPAAPVAPPAPVAAAFPPAGWLPHPASPGWFYSGQDVKSEADLRAMAAPAPAAPPAAPAMPAAPAWGGGAAAPAAAAPASLGAPAWAPNVAAAPSATPPWGAK